jgi:hypothetical protein
MRRVVIMIVHGLKGFPKLVSENSHCSAPAVFQISSVTFDSLNKGLDSIQQSGSVRLLNRVPETTPTGATVLIYYSRFVSWSSTNGRTKRVDARHGKRTVANGKADAFRGTRPDIPGGE